MNRSRPFGSFSTTGAGSPASARLALESLKAIANTANSASSNYDSFEPLERNSSFDDDQTVGLIRALLQNEGAPLPVDEITRRLGLTPDQAAGKLLEGHKAGVWQFFKNDTQTVVALK